MLKVDRSSDAAYKYSDDLVSLVEQCVCFSPVDRPKLRQTLKPAIVYFTGGGGPDVDRAQGMRHSAHSDNDHHLKLHHSRDKYRFMLAQEEPDEDQLA